MGKQRIQSYTPTKTAAGSNPTDAVNGNREHTRNEPHQTCIHSKSPPRERIMEKKEHSTVEDFWKEAVKSDSLLFWIVFNIQHDREKRA